MDEKASTSVVFITEVPAPYRSSLFRVMSKAVDLHVLYCSETDPWRGAATASLSGYEKVMDGFALGGGRGGTRWKFNPSVWRELSDLRPDVVVCGGYAHPSMQVAMLWCRLRKVPYLLHSESNDLTPRPAWRRALKRPIVRWAVAGAAAFLPVSSSAREYLIRRGGDARRMFILPNSPDVERIASLSRAEERKRENSANFIFVGRLVDAKDPLTLLEAFSRLKDKVPEAKLRFVGEGPLQTQLEAHCRQRSLEGEVEFAGFADQDELISHYRWADCFVLPSLYEPYGVVVLEAMAAGLPVIVSARVGSAADVVEPGINGFVFEAGAVQELAASMTHVVHGDPRRMGERSREMSLRFTPENGVGAVLEALRCATSLSS